MCKNKLVGIFTQGKYMTTPDKDKNNETPEGKEGEAPTEEGSSEEGGEGLKEAPKKSKKKYIFIAIFFILLLGTGGGFLVYLKHHKDAEEKKKQDEKAAENEVAYFDLDDILINLNTNGKNANFLKLKATLQVTGSQNLAIVKLYSPKIRDVFLTYLRELRPEDLEGSIGLYRLKEELLLRVNKIVQPAQVNDILFKDILVQ